MNINSENKYILLFQIYNVLIFYKVLIIIIITYIIILLFIYFNNNNFFKSLKNICEITFISYIIRNIFLMCYNILLNIKTYNDIIYENIFFVINRIYILSEYKDAVLQYLLIKGYTYQQIEYFIISLENHKIFEKKINMQTLYKIIDQIIFQLNKSNMVVNNNKINENFLNYLNDYLTKLCFNILNFISLHPYIIIVTIISIPLIYVFAYDMYNIHFMLKSLDKNVIELNKIIKIHQNNLDLQNYKNISFDENLNDLNNNLSNLKGLTDGIRESICEMSEGNKQIILKFIKLDEVLKKRIDELSTTLFYMSDKLVQACKDLELTKVTTASTAMPRIIY
jgi:hypothetical protein